MNEKEYCEYVKKRAKKSPTLKNCALAFLFGGLICTLGQGFFHLYTYLGLEETNARTLVSITLIFISCLLTGFGVFDNIARLAGAGTLVPITGFANAMSSASMEFKSEGLIFGTSVKLFSVVGPVIVNGIVWSTVAGILTLLWSMIF